MTVSGMVSGMDRESLERLAGEIVARLEGRRAPAIHTADGTQAPGAERAARPDPAPAGEEPARTEAETAPGAEKSARGAGESAYLTLRREPPPGAWENAAEKAAGGPTAVNGAADSADMQRISDFFMRDSRRYDSGFERY